MPYLHDINICCKVQEQTKTNGYTRAPGTANWPPLPSLARQPRHQAPEDLSYPRYLSLGLSTGSACQHLLTLSSRPSDALVISSPISRDMRWEALPVELLATWAKFNGVKYGNVEIRKIASDTEDRGAGVFALRDLQATVPEPSILMVIPQDLILSLPLVENYAKSDKHLREVLEAVGEFGRVRQMHADMPSIPGH
jgi:hypothetical protein